MYYTKIVTAVMLLGMMVLNASEISERDEESKDCKGEITDTGKVLEISSGALADPHEKLKIGSGHLIGTKKLLYKSKLLSRPQQSRLLAECKAELGVDVYSVIREDAKRKETRDEKRAAKKARRLVEIKKKYSKLDEENKESQNSHNLTNETPFFLILNYI